jgi:tRNA (guanine37-N1)-methyltransferase
MFTNVLKIPKKDAQKIHSILIQKEFLDKNYEVGKEEHFILFPIKQDSLDLAKELGEITQTNLEKRENLTRSIQELLKEKLTEQELELLGTSFDIIGDIAQIEIAEQLISKQEIIAKAILDSNKNVKTVAKKTSATQGPFRIREIQPFAGELKTHTIAKEYGCLFAIDLNQAYYTPRFSSERMRISRIVQSNETIMVPFAGVGPYPIIIEKHSNPKQIIAIELNEYAVAAMNSNILKNKCKKITSILGDANKVMQNPEYENFADRIIMPHPSDATSFLDSALKCAKNNCTIHLYGFGPVDGDPKTLFEKCQQIASKFNYTLILEYSKIARPYSSTQSQLVLDLRVIKKN